MKARVKSWEEIKKTVITYNEPDQFAYIFHKVTGGEFDEKMKVFCGELIPVVYIGDIDDEFHYRQNDSPSWYWHREWLEITNFSREEKDNGDILFVKIKGLNL